VIFCYPLAKLSHIQRQYLQLIKKNIMPTYTVTYSGAELSLTKKENIAQAITKTHHDVTDANTYFAQVIFLQTPRGNHYMSGKLVKDNQLFLHGQIRAGRPPELKEKLILGMREALIKNSGLSKDHIWIYIVDLIPAQMMEYGEFLPQSGKENEWFESLSRELQAKLKKMEN
jgi:phenylpyruvate tautomerase PptA (4-oxalocrotonate tautomerase family)